MLPIRYVAISRISGAASDIEICQVEVFLEARRLREDVLEGDLLALLVLARVVRGVEVLLEVGVEVDLVEGVALLLGRGIAGGSRPRRRPPRLRRLGFRLRDAPRPPLRRRLLLLLFEERVLDHLLGQDLFELELGHLQQLDGLLQRRRHDEPLREPEIQFLFEGHSSGSSGVCSEFPAPAASRDVTFRVVRPSSRVTDTLVQFS